MKHGKIHRKFGRETKQRKALLRDLARALIINGKIKTTEAKAKSLKPYVEKLITRGKRPGLASIRILIAKIGKEPTSKLMKELAPKFEGRKGGYTRIVKLPPRRSDGAKMSVIEFLS